MPAGRPTLYNEELAAKICERIIEGESLVTICKDEDFPALGTIFRWLGEEDKTEFRDNYARAKEQQADTMAEKMMAVAEDETQDVQRSRLIVDTYKWQASKLKPKKYSERLDVKAEGSFTVIIGDEDAKTC